MAYDRSQHRPPVRDPSGRLPPHDLEAERAVLARAILSEPAQETVCRLVPVDNLYAAEHRQVLQAVHHVRATTGRHADTVAVAGRLREVGVERISAFGDLVGLSPDISEAALEGHCARIADLARVRSAIAAAQMIAAEGFGDIGDPVRWLQEAADRLAVHAVAGPAQLWPRVDVGADLGPVPWIVPGLELAPGAPTLLAGYGFAGKTVALQSLALSISAGLPVWGRMPARRGRVLHLDYEQGHRLTAERYQRLARALSVPRDLFPEVVCYPPVFLDSPDAFAALCRELDGFALCIIDSLRAACPATDENDSTARAPLDMLSRVSERTSCGIVVIHHARKDQPGKSADAQSIRGSGALYDACQTVWGLGADEGEETSTLSFRKARITGRKLAPLSLRVSDVADEQDPRWGLEVRLEEPEQRTQRARAGWDGILDAVLAGVRRSVQGTSIRAIARELAFADDRFAGGHGQKVVADALDELRSVGAVQHRGKGPSSRWFAVAAHESRSAERSEW